MKLSAVLAVVVLLSGCVRTVDAKPQTEPQRIDCDLIFPGPSSR